MLSFNSATLFCKFSFCFSNISFLSGIDDFPFKQRLSTITNKLSGANVNSNAFKLHRNSMEDAPEEVETWLKQIDIID